MIERNIFKSPKGTRRIREIRNSALDELTKIATREKYCIIGSVTLHFFEDCCLVFAACSNDGRNFKKLAVSSKDLKTWKEYKDEFEPAEGYHRAYEYQYSTDSFLHKEWWHMTRQRKSQLSNIAKGLCQFCPRKLWLGSQFCKKHALKRGLTGTKLKRRKQWEKVNWNLTNKQIATKLGVKQGAVRWQRARRTVEFTWYSYSKPTTSSLRCIIKQRDMEYLSLAGLRTNLSTSRITTN